jgi:hypothetical protein
MSEKIDEVARAIADNIQSALPDGTTVDYEYAARAAIAAMREPTEAMVKAGNKMTDWASGAGDAWEVMVDELLK